MFHHIGCFILFVVVDVTLLEGRTSDLSTKIDFKLQISVSLSLSLSLSLSKMHMFSSGKFTFASWNLHALFPLAGKVEMHSLLPPRYASADTDLGLQPF